MRQTILVALALASCVGEPDGVEEECSVPPGEYAFHVGVEEGNCPAEIRDAMLGSRDFGVVVDDQECGLETAAFEDSADGCTVRIEEGIEYDETGVDWWSATLIVSCLDGSWCSDYYASTYSWRVP